MQKVDEEKDTVIAIPKDTLLAVLNRLKSKNRNPEREWYLGWNAALDCLTHDIEASGQPTESALRGNNSAGAVESSCPHLHPSINKPSTCMDCGEPVSVTSDEVVDTIAEIRARRAKVSSKWRSMRDGNQYLNGKYGQEYSTAFSENNCVGASVVEELPRAWNPFYSQDATELEGVSRFRDDDADFIAHAPTDIDYLDAALTKSTEENKRLLEAYDAAAAGEKNMHEQFRTLEVDWRELSEEEDRLRARLAEVVKERDDIKNAEIHAAQRCLAAESQRDQLIATLETRAQAEVEMLAEVAAENDSLRARLAEVEQRNVMLQEQVKLGFGNASARTEEVLSLTLAMGNELVAEADKVKAEEIAYGKIPSAHSNPTLKLINQIVSALATERAAGASAEREQNAEIAHSLGCKAKCGNVIAAAIREGVQP